MSKTHQTTAFLRLVFTLLLLIGVGTHTRAQNSFVKTQGKVLIDGQGDTLLIRSMGLGGWMVQEGYMLQTASFANAQHKIRDTIEALIGTAATDAFYEAWLENHINRNDIDSLAKWGFNTVRPALHYNLFTLPIEEEPVAGQQTWLTKGFELLDSLHHWCELNHMYIILDLHAAPGGQGYDEGISDYDPSKPSLWESAANRDKTVALWKKLAEKYAQDTLVIGYDLINEPNWNLPGGTALRALYEEITDSIRAVDTSHVLFIEGNWFANDFTGLTPPWDSNMVYSPHKYWSPVFAPSDIGYVTVLRDTYNVPVWLGETGENSNAWFTALIGLLEGEGIGWSWWPTKKVETINAPLSINKPVGYNALLDYWSGNTSTAPPTSISTGILNQLATNLKAENCTFNKDVIDAMFRQVYDKTSVPWTQHNIPGLIYAPDYDMGPLGVAYNDTDSYQLNPPPSWNNGWQYRNDGVDIETTQEIFNSNGYKVGFVEDNEWMNYTINVSADSVYEIRVRQGTNGASGANFYFEIDGAKATDLYYASNTGSWDLFSTKTIPDVVFTRSDQTLTFVAPGGGTNLISFDIQATGPISALSPEFMHARTHDFDVVEVHFNKPLDSTSLGALSDYSLFINGTYNAATQIQRHPSNTRILLVRSAQVMTFLDEIEITYSGSGLQTADGATVPTFTLEDVENTLPEFNTIPGRIQAESFVEEQGISLEQTTDVGGGQNIGYLDAGDYLIYDVTVLHSGTYVVDYRHASQSNGALNMELRDTLGNFISILHPASFAATGGWQDWSNTSYTTPYMAAGNYKLKVTITQAPFNLNWFQYTLAFNQAEFEKSPSVYPNPASSEIHIGGEFVGTKARGIYLYSTQGALIQRQHDVQITENTTLDIQSVPPGTYMLTIIRFDGYRFTTPVIIAR